MEKYYIIEGNGKNKRKREALKFTCPVCGKEFLKAKHLCRDGETHCCSRKCRSIKMSENHVNVYICDYCGKKFSRKKSAELNSRSGFHFCCRKCKDAAQTIYNNPDNYEKYKSMIPDHFGNGKNSENFDYRRFVLSQKPAKCERCGYDKNIAALQIHHKDRNRNNNSIENLEVLCANCHCIEHWDIKK